MATQKKAESDTKFGPAPTRLRQIALATRDLENTKLLLVRSRLSIRHRKADGDTRRTFWV